MKNQRKVVHHRHVKLKISKVTMEKHEKKITLRAFTKYERFSFYARVDTMAGLLPGISCRQFEEVGGFGDLDMVVFTNPEDRLEERKDMEGSDYAMYGGRYRGGTPSSSYRPGPTRRYARSRMEKDLDYEIDRILESDLRREKSPSLYRPLSFGDDRPSHGIGRLVDEEERNSFSSTVQEDIKNRQRAVKDAHRKMSAAYAESTARNDITSRMAAQIVPISMKATAVDEVVKTPNMVIMVNENALKKYQRTKMNRSNADFNAFKNNAIEHMRHLLGFDFSRTRNPNVHLKGDIMVLSEKGTDKVRLAPYILGGRGSASIKVTDAEGFPSIKANDPVTESGYVLSVIDGKAGVTAHGKYGGKEGKVLTRGQSFYFGEIFTYPSNGKYKPEWIRAVSFTPSIVSERNTSRAELNVKRVSLFEKGGARPLKDYKGKATRILKIELLKDDKDQLVAKKVNAVYDIKFST